MPKAKQPDIIVYSVRIDRATLERLKELALAGGRNTSQEVQLALRSWATKRRKGQ